MTEKLRTVAPLVALPDTTVVPASETVRKTGGAPGMSASAAVLMVSALPEGRVPLGPAALAKTLTRKETGTGGGAGEGAGVPVE